MEIFDIILLVSFFLVLSIVYGLLVTYAKGSFRIIFLSLYTIIGCTGIVFGFIGEWLYTPIGNIDAVAFKLSFPYALFPTFVIVLVCFLFFRKKYEKLNLYLVLAGVCLAVLSGLTAAGMGYVTFTNGYLDKSDAEIHQARVTEKSKYTSGKTTEYYVHFRHWGNGNHQKRFKVHRAFHENVEQADILSIQVKSGHYGVEWVVDYSRNKNM